MRSLAPQEPTISQADTVTSDLKEEANSNVEATTLLRGGAARADCLLSTRLPLEVVDHDEKEHQECLSL